ncbi:MAG: hypothetical protein KME04_19110 [Pleurocapsa minor GSE-CHR-MK-17-07R]|jgi:hypothetical protein|nr:hypothetical protein [Pleurocapsa minor GSE-CHR-MK 17-07R]
MIALDMGGHTDAGPKGMVTGCFGGLVATSPYATNRTKKNDCDRYLAAGQVPDDLQGRLW